MQRRETGRERKLNFFFGETLFSPSLCAARFIKCLMCNGFKLSLYYSHVYSYVAIIDDFGRLVRRSKELPPRKASRVLL